MSGPDKGRKVRKKNFVPKTRFRAVHPLSSLRHFRLFSRDENFPPIYSTALPATSAKAVRKEPSRCVFVEGSGSSKKEQNAANLKEMDKEKNTQLFCSTNEQTSS